MAFLEKFSDEEKSLLASLPYRAGLWVSTVDEEGGDYAAAKERAALEDIITKKAEGMFESAFVHEVMVETFAQKENWKSWGEHLENVPDECRKAVGIIQDKLAPNEVDAYRHNIMTISSRVAAAFREFDEKAAIPVKIWTSIKLGIDKIIGLFRGESYESEALLNVSYEEDTALARLSEALHAGVDDTAEDAAIAGEK